MKNKNKASYNLTANRAAMGHLRKSHFSSGGDLASWRGRHDVYVDRKKHANKRACRGKMKWD
jgi:hypothetical protein